MTSQSRTRIAVLVAQHPAVNHAGIQREIRELRRFLDISTASIRSSDRPLEQLTEEERDEVAHTFYIKARGFAGFAAALLATLFSRPLPFVAGLCYSVKLARLNAVQWVKNLAYFAEAVVLGRWMQQQKLKKLHVHYSSTVGLLVKRVFPIELSISFHGPDEFKDPVGFWVREKIEACDVVRAISHYARGQLMQTCSVEHWNKIEVNYMGIDHAGFLPGRFREHPDPVEIICVGRLAPVKAQHVLIAAVHQLARDGRNVLLHIVGGGPDFASLKQDVESRGIPEHVVIHGPLRHDKVRELYGRVDIFALASFAEGVPGVLMEAMAMEIPCVATWITGIPELIRDGIDGLLVSSADECAMAKALARMIDDLQLRRTLAANGRQRTMEKFDLTTNACQLADIISRPRPQTRRQP